MKIGDIVVGMFIIVSLVLMIIPLPVGILDFLIALNLAFGLIIVYNALFAKEALSMSSFPTILLFATLYRLSLNVASTRLILRDGDAGTIIETFGDFVGGGDPIVGIVIFIILIIIQFLVITKGSERVAEVSARFTLDAMPGKQMAIDADLNSGLIDEIDAKNRRQKIQDEASFYGSMDGASKFVKGDAIAGLIITFINIVGGIIMGSTRGMNVQEAMNHYTTLTIGDGLVSQIPALLIALATGVLVTKVSKEADVSDILAQELFKTPKVLYLSGSVLIIIGLFSPLNKIIVVGLGCLMIVAASIMDRNLQIQTVDEEVATEEIEADEIRKPENVVSLLQVDPIELEFGYGIIPLADVNQGGDLLDRVVMIRRQIAIELGTVVPIIRLRDNIQLNPNQYVVKIKGVQVSEGEILFDHYMAMNPGFVDEEIDGVETIEPAFNLPALWITEGQREKAETLGYTVVDPPSIIATHLTEIIKEHLDELLTREDVQTLISNIKETHPTLVDELVPKLMGVGEIQKVLQTLLKEGVSIRDLVTIFETLADNATSNRDTDILTEYVRQALKRTISKKYFMPNETTSVVTLDPAVEQLIMDSVKQTEQGAYLALDPESTQKIIKSTENEISKLEELGKQAIMISSPIVRIYFKRLTEEYFKNLIVISYNEIESNVELQSVGMVSIN
ncbi:flagellar biosynthesis protein FlhA [Natranaerovirga hydrolytica]|uniref:Flagellar biosynthesis protein FlhA n=1 Tax=Natranaerovirga hydrolytica TaxID=680378 RepID=A0A4R1N4N6_9FIRM|nr:flagellar biosynthesis protein FlhA [Natranaerovirga hydrolytica]TCK97909.1 flagellar biosynthesis protein FlhA [Natranaerovirga hydrolytica]